MTELENLPGLSQLKAARSYSEQAASLRALRDSVIGHVHRKDRWIKCGILELLVSIIQNNTVSTTYQNGKQPCGQSAQIGTDTLPPDEVVRLLCLQLLASFAYGGTSYLGSLYAVGVVPVILSNLSPLDNPPQVVLTALRALRNISTAAQLAPLGTEYTKSLSDALFTPSYLEALCLVLSQESIDTTVQEQKRLSMSLINQLCKEPHHQNALADSGILDALASILASFVVARGEVVPGADVLAHADGLVGLIPPPAPRGAGLALVLEALSTIVADSRFRSCLLLSSPAIMAVFPQAEFTPTAAESRAAWHALEMSGLGNIRARSPGAVDYLLPLVPVPQHRSLSSQFAQFPPLGFSLSRDNLASSERSSTFRFTGWDPSRMDTLGEDPDADDPESPLIPWLIHLTRSTDGLERTMAASLVTSLFKAGFASPEREQALALLLVPLLCQLILRRDKDTPQQALFVQTDMLTEWAIQEKTPEVLARLVADSETLQQAAHECGAINMAAKLLKWSYEPQEVQSAPPPWLPDPDANMDLQEDSPTRQVGPPAKLPAYVHKIKMRETALKLVAAMATLKEEYRKALAEQDIVSYIVESLSPSPSKPKSPKEKAAAEKETENGVAAEVNPYGQNPDAVIIAACHATRALSRSVSILRTTLQDNGVAAPISKLLRNSNAEVQIAASSAVINLVTSCSPMVKPLLEAGIVRTLCEQAHSLNAGLRLNSLWALKHLVVDVDNALRKQCLEELEPGWLVQLISDDTSEEEALQQTRTRSSRRAPDADDDEDMDAETVHDEDGNARSWTWPGLNRVPHPAASSSPRLQHASLKLSVLRDAEVNPVRRARNDSLAIQEQGLGFIRNLIMLTTPSNQTDMVDFLFSELGQDRLFGILADKLKVRVVGAFGRRHTSTSNNNRGRNNGSSSSGTATTSQRDAIVLYPQARIIENLTYILVHIAASVPRHRQLVVAQTDLLKLLGGHFNNKDVGVRRALCQLFMNLLCLESDGDRQPCEQRASELERLGFLAKLEGLEQGDADLDVRERAKAAVGQLKGGGV